MSEKKPKFTPLRLALYTSDYQKLETSARANGWTIEELVFKIVRVYLDFDETTRQVWGDLYFGEVLQ